MTQPRLSFLAAMLLLLGVAVFAQPPDFSGKWVPADPAYGTATITVKQTPDTLTVETLSRIGALVRKTYKLDGSETELPKGSPDAEFRGSEELVRKTIVNWIEGTLILTTRSDISELTDRWSLSNGMLTIARTAGPRRPTIVYKKTP